MREWKEALATRIQARWRGIKGRARATGWGEYLAQLDAAALTAQRFARGRLAGYRQGLTLVHFSAQSKHILWVRWGHDFPQSIRQGDTGRCDPNGLG
jgi:hypothetical protein